jgi:ankyrin
MIATMLLDLGTTLDETVNEAFLEAAEAGHELMVQLLIIHGIDLSFKDTSGYTALHRAVLGSQIKVLELLLNTEADISARDNRGKTALHLAAQEGEDEIAQVLLGISEIRNLQDCDGWTALHWAVNNEHENTVQSLLDAGVDPGISSFNACTPLDLAEVGALETIEQMLREALAATDRPTIGDAPP